MASNTSIYGQARSYVWDKHAALLEGGQSALILVLFSEPLEAPARDALDKSFAALGHRPDEVAFAHIGQLEPLELFELVEGLDPLYLVAADAPAARAYADCCKQEFPLKVPARMFGRDACAFEALNRELSSDADKQRVWKLLKGLLSGSR